MKSWIRAVFLGLFTMMVVFTATAFMEKSLNPLTWTLEGRGVMAVVCAVVVLFLAFALWIETDKE